MNVLVICGGGREHAIVKKINESKKVKKFTVYLEMVGSQI